MHHNVKIGNGGAIIGDRVYIGAGGVILGNITIGDDVAIGANTVVILMSQIKVLWSELKVKSYPDSSAATLPATKGNPLAAQCNYSEKLRLYSSNWSRKSE